MKKSIIQAVILAVLVVSGCSNFELLDKKKEELYSKDFPNKGYKLKVVHTPSNATVQSYIQVLKQYKDKEELVTEFERYNYMDTCKFIDDTTFMLVIRDTVSYLGNKPDTMKIIVE